MGMQNNQRGKRQRHGIGQYSKWNERRVSNNSKMRAVEKGSSPSYVVDLSGKWATVENCTMLSPVPVVNRKK